MSKQRKIIHFSSGETLEEEGSEEEEEQPSDSPSFREPAKRVGQCLKEKGHVKCNSYITPFCFVSSISDQVLAQDCCHSCWQDFTAEYVIWQIPNK